MSNFGSLSLRIYGVAALVAAIALLLGAMMLQSSSRSQDAFGWVSHTQEVIISLDALQGDLERSDSRLRGYLLTQDESYLQNFDKDVDEANALAAKLARLVADNPFQVSRAVQLTDLGRRDWQDHGG